MRMRRTVIALVILTGLTFLSLPDTASAQPTAWGDNGYISINGFYDATTSSYETLTSQDFNLETVQLTTSHEVAKTPVYDLTVGGRLKGNLGMGFGFSYAKQTDDAEITGGIPHPFYYDQPRALAATTKLDREDVTVHIHGMWLLPLTERFQVALFGGPTWFRVTQETVKSIEIDDSFPFDSVTLTKAELEKSKGSHWGYNAGFDASVFFSAHVGVHGIVRYAQGTITISPGGHETSFDIGGLQLGAGLRFRY